MVTTVSNNSSASAAGLSASTSGSGLTSAQEQSDRFLKLLVAQLNNQDPMNPMDNAQMTSQMAQINTVSGIQQLNDTMKSMATQFTAMQTLQGAAMVGREVLASGNTMAVSAGVGKASLDLSAPADAVSVQVLTTGGQLMGTLNLGAIGAGRHNFEWDASGYTGSGNPIFKVTATQSGKAVSASPLTRSTVESISTDSGGLSLNLKNGTTLAYSEVKAIL